MIQTNEEQTKQDSFTLGTPGKEGSVKLYFNMETMDDDKLKELVRRAIGLYKYSQTIPK